MPQCFDAGGTKVRVLDGARRTTNGECLIAQTVAVLQQHHLFAVEIAQRHELATRKRVIFRHCQQEWFDVQHVLHRAFNIEG